MRYKILALLLFLALLGTSASTIYFYGTAHDEKVLARDYKAFYEKHSPDIERLAAKELDNKRRVVIGYIREKRNYTVPESFVPLIADAVISASENNNMELSLAMGLIQAENGFGFMSTSVWGAIGPAQVMPIWIKIFGLKKGELFDPTTNCDVGMQILAKCIDEFGLIKGLSAYNLGRTAVAKGQKNSKYVNRVLNNKQMFEKYMKENV